MIDVETRKFLDAIIEELQNIDGGGSVDYSTEEKKVGKWIDGSDLYKRTISKASIKNTSVNFEFTGATNFIKIDIISDTGKCIPFFESESNKVSQWVEGSIVYLQNNWSNRTFYVTATYKK